MENDRELLELAAKAAGYTVNARMQAERDAIGAGDVGLWINGVSTCWNPLTDDGDALRLAVKFKMEIDHNHPADQERWVSVRAFPARLACIEDFDDESLREKATRLAILRASIRAAAAAEVERSMG